MAKHRYIAVPQMGKRIYIGRASRPCPKDRASRVIGSMETQRRKDNTFLNGSLIDVGGLIERPAGSVQ